MKRPREFSALIGLLVLFVPCAGGELPSLQDAVPADATAMVYAEDVAGLVARWRATPFAGLWADPQVQRFLAPWLEDLEVDSWDEELEEDTGYTSDELLAMFSGEVVWYMGRLENLTDHLDGDFQSMEEIITDVRRGGVSEPLSTSPTFQSAAGHVRSSDVVFFMNLEMLMPLVREVMVEEMASSAQSSPIPVEPGALYDALGLGVLRAAFAGFTVGRSLIEADMSLTYTGNSGLVKMIAYGPGEAPRPTLIPPDSPAFGTARVDFQQSWRAIEEIVGGINPALSAMATAQLAARIQAAGIELDLRRDLLENLGGDLVMIQMAPSRIGPADGAAGIHYQDMAAMGQAILELLRSAAALSPDTGSQPGDFGEIPDSNTIGKYLGPAVTGVYKDDSSLVMRTRLLAAEGRVE